uniref:Immunoglobulin V-set domain-containing protein n=1 Tax=Oreochromis niloticus TaxID=8128 RepID=A0A669ENG8_ORENI
LSTEHCRADLGDEYVLFYRKELSDSYNGLQSFMNRVDLHDRQMTDGDVSLILKDVTPDDTGTYKCRVFMRGTYTEHISIIYLYVVDPPGERVELSVCVCRVGCLETSLKTTFTWSWSCLGLDGLLSWSRSWSRCFGLAFSNRHSCNLFVRCLTDNCIKQKQHTKHRAHRRKFPLILV